MPIDARIPLGIDYGNSDPIGQYHRGFEVAQNIKNAPLERQQLETETQDAELKAATNRLTAISGLLNGVQDQRSYSMARDTLARHGIINPADIPEQYDPAYVEMHRNNLGSQLDRMYKMAQIQEMKAGGSTGVFANRLRDEPDLRNAYFNKVNADKGITINPVTEQAETVPGYDDALAGTESKKSFAGTVGDKAGEQLIELRTKAKGANESLQQNATARKVLDEGVKTGFGANFRLGFGKALKLAGINYAKDEIANTEAYFVSRAKQVAENIKNFGAGTGLSDADREYAEKMASGKISLEEQSIRKILDLDDRASKRLIERYNKEYALTPPSASPYDLGVEEEVIPDGTSINTTPRRVSPKEYQSLPSGTQYIDPNGNIRRKK